MRATVPVPQPAPLSLAAHAAEFGLDENVLAGWLEANILVVHFDAAGRVSHADIHPAPGQP